MDQFPVTPSPEDRERILKATLVLVEAIAGATDLLMLCAVGGGVPREAEHHLLAAAAKLNDLPDDEQWRSQ